jgi:S1-C subfamily serine protease
MGATLLACVTGAGALLGAQSADERAAARDVAAKRGDAVVMVLATVKLQLNVGGREQNQDRPVQTNATVLDGTGLAVTSLSLLQPDDMLMRTFSAQMPPGTSISVTSEPSDVKMHLADGREVPARIVLRDADLDLAFLKPSEPLAAPIPAVDGPSGKVALMDPLMVLQRMNEAMGWKVAASLGQVQLVLDKPRTYYQVSIATVGSNGLGSPLFDTKGGFIGVLVLRSTGPRSPGSPGVLAADDIRDVAKQAK